MKHRACGILLHVSSLPGPFGIGDLGPCAYRFVDFLADSGQSYWQILPLSPTEGSSMNSPYHSTSAFAGNPFFISPEDLVRRGLLEQEALDGVAPSPASRVDYAAAHAARDVLLRRAWERFERRGDRVDFERFCAQERDWLEDYALFRALKTHFGGIAWHQWPHELRDREEHALAAARRELNPVVTFEQFLQYLFFSQWLALKDYCRQKGVRIIGDVPIYVTHDGVELWTNPACFKLDGDRNPVAVAGVPPDYFSATGQLWGNPVYDWETLRQSGYAWWLRRIEHNLRLVDVVRIDHFRGLVAFWEVKMPAATAVTGCWVEVPAWDFFHRLTRKFPCLPMVAEDLGTITADVREVMRHFDIPGMKVLLFGFGTDLPQNPYIPHNLPRDCVAYTGTHDNNTARGWFESEASPLEKENLYRYLGRHVIAGEVPWELIRLLMRSAAATVILPLQDVLALGSEARMNTPATTQGNWEWRVTGDLLTREVSGKLRAMTEITGRLV